MWQRRGESADQLVGMRSTCPVRADSPLTAVCQPEKEASREEGLREGGREEGREKVIRRRKEKDKEGLREQKKKIK